VNFINNGSYPVHVSWIPSNENACASIEVEPKSFEVTDRTKISVHIEPLCPGPFREMLRFLTKNRDCDTGETIVYVRGTVEQIPNVRVRPAIAPLDNICAGTLNSYDVEFNVISNGSFSVQRYLYEFDTIGTLSLHGDIKSFGPYGNENMMYTTLNFKTPVETEVSENSGKKTRSKNSLVGNKIQLIGNLTLFNIFSFDVRKKNKSIASIGVQYTHNRTFQVSPNAYFANTF